MHQRALRTVFKVWVAFTATCLFASEFVFAQSYGQQRNQFGAGQRNRTTVSPYLSIIDNTGTGQSGLNYYNIVKPRERSRQAYRELENDIQQVESGLQRGRTQSLSPNQSISITTGRMQPTGHTTSFGNTGSYFGNQGGGRGGGGNGNENSFGRYGQN